MITPSTFKSMRQPANLFPLVMALLIATSPALAKDPFLDAQDAFQKGNAKRLAAAATKLKTDTLLPYIEYFQLRLRIEKLTREDIDTFLQRYSGDYLADAMLAEWLKHLVRNDRWKEFEAVYPRLQQPDAEMRCLELRARYQRPAPELEKEARTLWRGQAEIKEACNSLFTYVFNLNLLPEDEIWLRAQQQFEAHLYTQAKITLDFLPETHRVKRQIWSEIRKKPQNFLADLPTEEPLVRRNRELVTLAIQRLAAIAPRDAAEQLRRLSPILPSQKRDFLWGQIATEAAANHLPEALGWYSAVDNVVLSDEQQRWAVRAALRAGDWEKVNNLIKAMPQYLANEPAWIYWLGRAELAAGRTKSAEILFNSIAGNPTFYSVLAEEELGRPTSIPPQPTALSKKEIAAAAENHSIRRAMALFKLGQRIAGTSEWNWGIAGMSDRQLLAAAELAKRNNIFDVAINTAGKTLHEHNYSLRYLTPHTDKIRDAATKVAIDEAWIYGLIRQESRFVIEAESTAGAQGLMQLMPNTAYWIAKKTQYKKFRRSKIQDVSTNIQLGTAYLRTIYDGLSQNQLLASSAYNAGPSRARRWRDPQKSLEGAIYAETIPFSETRRYAKNVLTNAVFYSRILDRQGSSLKNRLGVISPSDQ